MRCRAGMKQVSAAGSDWNGSVPRRRHLASWITLKPLTAVRGTAGCDGFSSTGP